MTRIYTSAETRAIDREAAEMRFLPTALLMENAGREVAAVAIEAMQRHDRQTVIVVCGKGNNGGDGYVAARHLKAAQADVFVISAGELSELKGDAHQNAQAAVRCDVPRLRSIREWLSFGLGRSARALVVVDAVLGTGLSRPAEGRARELIEQINEAHRLGASVVAVDVPSGIDADKPTPAGAAVHADHTVALHSLKPAHVQYPARGLCGEIHVASIGLPGPHTSVTGPGSLRVWSDRDWMRRQLPRRPADVHKGIAGHVLVVAGSAGKSGAAYMSCAGALRSGAGLVTLASAPEVIDRVLPQLPEAMGHGLPTITADGLSQALTRMSALVIGPGIPRDEQTGPAIVRVLRELNVPAIIDADGLNTLAQSPEALRQLPQAQTRPVLTPHPAELARLLQCSTEDIQRDRLAAAVLAAHRFQAHVILKGACSVIAHPDGSLAVNATGTPAMATAGMGDVLSGIVGALLGQRLSEGVAAEVATWVHGRAGELAVKGDRGLIAADVIAQLPAAFAEIVGT